MQATLKKTIALRENGEHEQALTLLEKMIDNQTDDPEVYFQHAWCCDVLGFETKAAPSYEKAIALGLRDKSLEMAYIGLGSTWRTLGAYEKSQRIFQQGMQHFPDNMVLQVFYSMTLYNLNQADQAMETLLKTLLKTTADENILAYGKAIEFYASQLDRKWL